MDLVRESITFQSISDLTQCLENLAQDPSIRILRIKNSLRGHFHSRKSGGYRNVLVNLRVVNPRTTELCVKDHVCELQLTLMPFMVIRTHEAHERYKVMPGPTNLLQTNPYTWIAINMV